MQIRVAPSLGSLEGTPEQVWGTTSYTQIGEPAVFMGVYGLPDFYALWRHKGERHILWCGSDIRHLQNGYWLDDVGKLRLDNKAMARWISANCTSWVENLVEWNALANMGIQSNITPSFMGDIDDFPVSYKHSYNPKVYASVSGNDFGLYGWDQIERVAAVHPEIEFHLYGNSVPWDTKNPNVVVHGRVPKEVMNEQVKNMQGGLRLLPFDGFSEIIAKSVLWGQWPISLIPYPHVLTLDDLPTLRLQFEPNIAGRNYYRAKVNQYPWNTKIK